MESKHFDELELRAATLAADHQTKHITEKTIGILNDTDLLKKIAASRSKMAIEKAQGFSFEQLEVIKFNLDSLKKDSSLHAATTDSLGMNNHEVADVIIRNGRRKIRSFQLKSGNNAARTAYMLADEKYSDIDLVGPSDQHADVKRLYRARISTGTLKANDYASAEKRLHKRVEAENVSSGGTKYSEALNATDPKEAEKLAYKFKREGVATEMHRSGLEAGKIGATISGGVSGISGLIKLSRGEAEPVEIVAKVAIDAAKGYVTSYVTTAMSKGISHAARTGIEKTAGAEFAKTTGSALTKSNAHVALAAGIVQCGKSLLRYINGEIDDEQLLSDVSHTAITGATAFYYGALGQAVIPIPIIGAFIGSTVGYFVGNMLHQSSLVSLGEAPVVKAARERRERVAAFCMTAIPLMRAHRMELEKLISEHFAERHHLLTTAFNDLESSLFAWDADQFIASLERVNNAFGAALPFKTFDEFDEFMKDDSQRFVL